VGGRGWWIAYAEPCRDEKHVEEDKRNQRRTELDDSVPPTIYSLPQRKRLTVMLVALESIIPMLASDIFWTEE